MLAANDRQESGSGAAMDTGSPSIEEQGDLNAAEYVRVALIAETCYATKKGQFSWRMSHRSLTEVDTVTDSGRVTFRAGQNSGLHGQAMACHKLDRPRM